MAEHHPSPDAKPPAQLAKAALRRLAHGKLEPTPENYARAYAQEQGEGHPDDLASAIPVAAHALLDKLLALGITDVRKREELSLALRKGAWDKARQALDLALETDGPGPQAKALADLIERLVRGLQGGSRQWTTARKKDSLQRVLDGSASDMQRMLQRVKQLVHSWGEDASDTNVGDLDALKEPKTSVDASDDAQPLKSRQPPAAERAVAPSSAGTESVQHWPAISSSLHAALQVALPRADDASAAELSQELSEMHSRLLQEGASAVRMQEAQALCDRAKLMLEHRHHLFGELGGLCAELTASLTELAEDDSWVEGQAAAMRNTLEQGLNARGVRSVSELLVSTRQHQQSLRDDRAKARDALKSLIQRMLHELGELGQHTDRFSSSMGRYAEIVEKADSLESLTGAVREIVEESRSVQGLVHQAQERLHAEHARATELSQRVDQLESELRRLSDEVSTDQLTQIANRRGLVAAFEVEQAKLGREGSGRESPLALGLLDVDNFKKLNDSLGHNVGDVALKALAEKVLLSLRPGDMVARYGGEEFVVMLPNTPLTEAQQVLSRLQRSLTAGLFMHEGESVFVTFSAGVTLYHPGERLEQALNRSDMALYEAKRTGKNRTCLA